MARTGAACIALVCALFGAQLDGQRLGPAVLRSSTSSSALTSRTLARPAAPTHWLEGALIGGIATGVLGAYVAHGFCGDPDSNTAGRGCFLPTIEGLVIGAIPGVVIGGIIGGLIAKTPPDSGSAP